jgi:multimeric flavodoxin WrbA
MDTPDLSEAGRLIRQMRFLLNPRAARGVNKSFSFRLNGPDGGDFSLLVRDGRCEFLEQVMDSPDLLIEGSAQAWIDIALLKSKPWQPFRRKELRFSRGGMLGFFSFGRIFSGDPLASEVPEGLFAETDNEIEFRKGRTRPARNVLLIQGAPRGRGGATECFVTPLIEGLRASGATVDTLLLAEMDIKPCSGCYTCWTTTDGICVFKDDMPEILARFTGYDLVIPAIPLYADSVPALYKIFQERLLPLLHPYIFNKNGRSRHPSRHRRMPNQVLVSVCGFYELENFEILTRWLESSSANSHIPVVAHLLRPHAMVLTGASRFAAIDAVDAAMREAGRQLACTGTVSKATCKAVAQPLMKRGMFLAATKHWWKNDFNDSVTKKNA